MRTPLNKKKSQLELERYIYKSINDLKKYIANHRFKKARELGFIITQTRWRLHNMLERGKEYAQAD